MNTDSLLDRLEATPAILSALVKGVRDDDARWKPPSGAWSILEVVNHLADEDADDFRPRLEITLRSPESPWPPLNPEGSATERRYNERDLSSSVARFVQERSVSLAFVRSLQGPDWSRAHRHPIFGPIAAGDLLASWAAHDALHIRQIAKRLFELCGRDGEPYRTAYAGPWGP